MTEKIEKIINYTIAHYKTRTLIIQLKVVFIYCYFMLVFIICISIKKYFFLIIIFIQFLNICLVKNNNSRLTLNICYFIIILTFLLQILFKKMYFSIDELIVGYFIISLLHNKFISIFFRYICFVNVISDWPVITIWEQLTDPRLLERINFEGTWIYPFIVGYQYSKVIFFHIGLWQYEYIPFFKKYVLFLPYTQKYLYYLAVGWFVRRVSLYYKNPLLYKAIILQYSRYLYDVNLFFVNKAKRIKKFFIYWFVYTTTANCSVCSAILLYERCYFLFITSLYFYVYMIQFKYNGEIVLIGSCPYLENPFDMHHPLALDLNTPLPSPPLIYDLEYEFKEVEEKVYPRPKFPSLLTLVFFISIAWCLSF